VAHDLDLPSTPFNSGCVRLREKLAAPMAKMLRRLGLGPGSSDAGSLEGLRSDLYTTEGPIGMKILADPPDPVAEYVLRSVDADKLLTLAV
jgi:hypothetical protein